MLVASYSQTFNNFVLSSSDMCLPLASVLCVGTYAPWTYYGFYCRPTPRAVYLATIVLLCLATIVITLADRSDKGKKLNFIKKIQVLG